MTRMEFREAHEILCRNRTKARCYRPAVGRNPPTSLIEFLVRRFKANASFGRRRGTALGTHCLEGFKALRKHPLPQHSLEHETANQSDNGRGHWKRGTSGGNVRTFLESASDVLHDLARRPLARCTRYGPGRARLFAGPNQVFNRIPTRREGRIDI